MNLRCDAQCAECGGHHTELVELGEFERRTQPFCRFCLIRAFALLNGQAAPPHAAVKFIHALVVSDELAKVLANLATRADLLRDALDELQSLTNRIRIPFGSPP